MGDYDDKKGKMMTPAEAMSRAANEAMEREGPQTPEQMFPRSFKRLGEQIGKVEQAMAKHKTATERVEDAMNKRRTPEGSLGHALAAAMEAKQEHMREVDRAEGKATVFGGTEPVKESEAPVKTLSELFKFMPGDVVQLKSGGPEMVVENCKIPTSGGAFAKLQSVHYARCCWFNDGVLMVSSFSFDTLNMYKKGHYHD